MSDDIGLDKDAYLKAQKQRNLFIGLGLGAFVALVFFISMVRMSQGLHQDKLNRQQAMHAASLISASASQ